MVNLILAENLLPGSPRSEWDIAHRGSTNIEGFATAISVNRGQTVNFKIDSDSAYKMDIYRLGYYGGDGARLITTIDGLPAMAQPDPIRVASTGLVDAGNWDVTASWAIPADMTSGVYIAKLTRVDGTGDSHIPFIVRADGSTSDIVFQTSDTTWQAYNTWGSVDADGTGASLYGGDSPPDRAFAVSYNRPIVTRDDGPSGPAPWNFIFGPEYSAIYWLEQNGYDITYTSGVDTDRSGSSLLDHKLFLTAGHDEYWSGQQRAYVEAARDAGVNLAFWTANEVYWRVRWETSVDDSRTPYRTMVSYKESFIGDIDPSDEWTGTFRDGRFTSPTAQGGGIPENALVGNMFGAGYSEIGSSHSTILIPYKQSQFRFWRDTEVAKTQPGQEFVLAENLLKYEFNATFDNGFAPNRLIPLSSTTITITTPEIINDYGSASNPGVVTHNLTLYRTQSGALVFGAGSVFWSFALSGDMDAGTGTTPDRNVQQAMVNLFADMGIQPGSIEPSLVLATVSSDATRPITTVEVEGSPTAVEGQVVIITGTATDVDGDAATQDGKVAAIEVSMNGGVTWRVGEGTTNWRYDWVARDPGEHIIMARAIDDSLNIQDLNVASVLLNVVPAGTGTVAEVVGSAAADSLVGAGGQDWMFGFEGVDELIGMSGNDFLFGGTDQDWIFGMEGIDELNGETGNDFLFGGTDQDWISGMEGIDELNGETGNDFLFGGLDQDWSYGGEGDDFIDGGEDNDFLFGGLGRDQLHGGSGSDVFVFRSAEDSGPSEHRRDLIDDFAKGVDLIDLSGIGSPSPLTFSGNGAKSFAVWTQSVAGGDSTIIFGDITGDAAADFQIELSRIVQLAKEDFHF